MSLLTDTNLRDMIALEQEWVDKNKIYIYPFSESNLTPVGYDLSVGDSYASAYKPGRVDIRDGDRVIIKPGDTALITTLEKIGMPQNRTVSALVLSKVSKVSKGLSNISTTIDPDWKGELLVAIHNHSRSSVSIGYGETFCTVVFLENKSPATKDCEKDQRRADILVNEWTDVVRKSNRSLKLKETVKLLVPIGIILFFSSIGYRVFGNSPGFGTMTTVGVALSQVALNLLIMRK
jgi:deoxycytidine triphosphate deaminase